MSPTSSIVLASALVLLGVAVVVLAVRRHRGGRHRAPEPMAAVLAARTGVGAVAVGSMASSTLVLVGHGASTGTTVQAAEQASGGTGRAVGGVDAGGTVTRRLEAAPSAGPAITGRVLDRSPTGPAPRSGPENGGYVVVPPPRSPLDDGAIGRSSAEAPRHGHARRPVTRRGSGSDRAVTRHDESHGSGRHASAPHPRTTERRHPSRHRAVERDEPCPTATDDTDTDTADTDTDSRVAILDEDDAQD